MCRRVSACENFLNFSVRMLKNHIFCDRSIERTVQNSFAQSQKLSLKKAKLSLKKTVVLVWHLRICDFLLKEAYLGNVLNVILS